jgi:hypothetical protein
MSAALTFVALSIIDAAAREQHQHERQVAADANTLLAWLRSLEGPASLKVLAQRSPRPFRAKARREAAVALLVKQKKIRREQRGAATVLVVVP